jgi:hypothetical protein
MGSTLLIHLCSLFSPSLCTLAARSFILAMASLTTRSMVRQARSMRSAPRVGSGGYQLSGSFSGPGSMRHTYCGNPAVSVMSTAGAYRQFAVVSLGKSSHADLLQLADASSLPATPLWFTGMYIPQMGPLDAVLPPAVWFSICIFFMEVFTIGFPIADIIKGNSLRKETLDAIKDWERCQALNAGDGSMTGDMSFKSPSKFSDSTTLKSSGGNVTIDSKDSFESNKSDMLTMTALENALRTNATPL